MIDKTTLYNCKDLNVARVLIDSGANVNHVNNNGETPLFFRNNIKVCRLLIDSGANVNHVNNNGETPLFSCDNTEVCKLLIDSGANVNYVKDDDGYTPLFWCDNIEICKLLIDSGANINHINKYGDTLLEYLCEKKYCLNYHNNIIKYLLEETDIIVTSKAVDLYYGNKEFYDQKVYDLLLSKEITSTTKSANKI